MLIYYLVVIIVLLVAGPFLLLIPKTRKGLAQKFGSVPAGIGPFSKKPIWFHCVSVGEFNAALPLIKLFHETHPDIPVAVSTATATGQQQAKEKVGEWATVFYFPLDLPFALNNWLKAINPALVAIVETEIWPGFMHECAKRKIPVMVINGCISPRSFKTYKKLSFFFGPVVRSFSFISAQSPKNLERYRSLAGIEIPGTCPGNLKVDGLKPVTPETKAEIAKKLNLSASDAVIIGGSTHEGEESVLLSVYKRLITERSWDPSFVPTRLILVPRHPERFEAVTSLVKSMGLNPRLYSRGEGFESDNDVFILDTIGQLSQYYCVATIAFVGGTLVPIGGHNLLEPYAYNVPVICGKHIDKTRDIANGLLDKNALIMVNDGKELYFHLALLLKDEARRKAIGEAGNSYLSESQGAVKKTLSILEKQLGVVYELG
ncbi:MAG: 3-deoxy-D-manno-octulosonic acid transferase [Candidatus Obscuribacterales bacterium]|nr:3-deoxy-D-manno-octulosonic acid transferase [Candidatus Obscuribacterales bacterium]